jgi:hypothetical protein
MTPEIENDLRLFKIWKKMPKELKEEFSILITPENLLGVNTHPNHMVAEVADEHYRRIHNLLSLSYQEMYEIYSKEERWNNQKAFSNFISILKEYLRLRPNLFEDYPELLI